MVRFGWLLPVAACALRDDDFDLDGWSAAEGDCDDLDPRVHPGRPELPEDGIDQDCDGMDVVATARGAAHSCQLEEDGSIRCNGANDHHQLDVPEHDSVFVALAAGDYHTCALDRDGFIACWGDDTYGQSSPPLDGGFVAIDAGGNWSLGSRDEATADCWGQCRVQQHLQR